MSGPLFALSSDVVLFQTDFSATLRLENVSGRPVSYKVRLTHPQCFVCKPPKGQLGADDNVELLFNLTDSTNANEGRFMIVVTDDADETCTQKVKLGCDLTTVQQAEPSPQTPQPPAEASPLTPSDAPAATSAAQFFIGLDLIELAATFVGSAHQYSVQWKRGSINGVTPAFLGGGSRVTFNQRVVIPAQTTFKADGTVAKRLLQLSIVEELDTDGDAKIQGEQRIVGVVKIDTTEFVAEPRQADVPLKLSESVTGEGILSLRISMSYTNDFSAQGEGDALGNLTAPPAAAPSTPPPPAALSGPIGDVSSESSLARPAVQPRTIPAIPSTPSKGANPLEAFERDKPKSTNMMVCIRVRPLMAKLESTDAAWTIENNGTSIIDTEDHKYDFDKVIDPSWNNKKVYDEIAPRFVENATIGINGTIFMYGQTASGKTHTMFGEEDEPGITPMVIGDIFHRMEQEVADGRAMNFSITASYFEIYNEELNDLLNPTNKNVLVRSGKDGAFVADVTREPVSSAKGTLATLYRGSENKKMGQSHLNDRSSRSHTIFQLRIKCARKVEGSNKKRTTVAELNLVDLAGSETLSDKGDATQKKETSHINSSLTFLKKVISELAHRDKFVSYRNSVLTKILKQSLGGNSSTCVMCCVTVAKQHHRNTRNTLAFGSTARTVKTNVKVNAETDENLREEVKNLREQIKAYQDAIAAYQGIEEDLRRTEEDNMQLLQKVADLEDQLASGQYTANSIVAEQTAATDAEPIVEATPTAASGEKEEETHVDPTPPVEEEVEESDEELEVLNGEEQELEPATSSDDDEALELLEESGSSDDEVLDVEDDDQDEGAASPPPKPAAPTALHDRLAPTTRPAAKGGADEDSSRQRSGSTVRMTEVERLRKQLMQQRVEHRAQLLRKNEELRAALASQQSKATTEVPEVLRKEEKICTLLDQIHSFLHYGTIVSVVDPKTHKLHRRWLHLHTGKDSTTSIQICGLSEENSTKPNKKEVFDSLTVKDCKRLELGQFSDGFEKAIGIEDQRSTVDRYRMSFTIVGRKKKFFDIVCEDESDFEAWVIELNKLLGNVAEWKKPLDVSKMDGAELLDKEEEELCTSLHIHPAEYTHAKTQMTKLNEKFVTLFDVRSLTKLDLYHSQRFFYFLRCRGWVAQASMFYLTEKFTESSANLEL